MSMPSTQGTFGEFGTDHLGSDSTLRVLARHRLHSLAGSLGRWPDAKDGTVAVEVGLLALPFFMLIVGIVAIGFMSWCHSTLDYATQKAARQIMTGLAQVNNTTAINFRTQTLCAYLPQGAFNCNNLVVNLRIVSETSEPTGWTNYIKPNFSAMIMPPLDNTQTAFCMGAGNTYQILEVLYPLPWYLGSLVTNPQATNNQFVIMSTAAFKTEPFPGAVTPQAGC